MPIKSFHDLDVYQLSHAFAIKIFFMTSNFLPEEKYSLTDQIRRSSRSIAVNIAEGWGKRVYINNFKKQLVDANGSLEESKSWLLFSKDCNYISKEQHDELLKQAELIGSKIRRLHERWK